MQGGELYLMEENAPAKASQQAAPQAPAQAAPAPKPQAVVPERKRFRWHTPLGVAKDFTKGTVLGFGKWLGKGAQIGLKVGLAAGTVAFFAPVVPAFMTVATALGLPGVGAMMGFEALLAGGLYAAGGALAGAAFGGGMGLLTGGAHEVKMRMRRETYADELAERAEVRGRQQQHRPQHTNWRQYAQAVRQQQNDDMTRLFYFNDEHREKPQQQSWAERVHASRQQHEHMR